jgi:hypothetical protein
VTLAGLRIVVCRSATVGRPRTGAIGDAMRTLAREFPTLAIDVDDPAEASSPPATVDLAQWSDRRLPFDPFDAAVEALARSPAATLVVRGAPEPATQMALEATTRWQWLIGRRNAVSDAPEFDELLDRMAALHDLDKPLVRADYIHALDTWQWVLRLDPSAGAAVQMAALLHDVERLESEADERVEHRAPNYARFKASHAQRGAAIARALLESCGVAGGTTTRAAALVAEHETPGVDPERALLNDADGLSFFSRNSAGYADYFGPVQMRRKVAYTLARMRAPATARLATVRLRKDVAAALTDLEDARIEAAT